MAKETKPNGKKKRSPMELPNQAVNAYHEGGDPLGQYTGTPELGTCMPRLRVEGKTFLKVHEKPTQDADDL